jgi:hypothetical protein
VAYTSNLAAVRTQMNRALDAGLIAAAQVPLNAIKKALAGGYTTGDYVTGASVSAATRTDPTDENGVRVIRIGTKLGYNRDWEMGFVPARGVFSPGLGRATQGPIGFRRKEIWVPNFFGTANEQALAFGRTFVRFMDQGPRLNAA